MNLGDFIMNTNDETLIRVYKIGQSLNMPFADAALPEEHISNMPEETKNLSVCFWGIEELKPKTDPTPVLWVMVE